MAVEELVTYMGYMWASVDDGVLSVGINDEGLNEFSELSSVNLPAENEEVTADEICGELDTDQGPLNIYAPISGKVVEINEAVVENPSLIMEDSFGDGWLFKIEPNDPDDLESLGTASTNDEDS